MFVNIVACAGLGANWPSPVCWPGISQYVVEVINDIWVPLRIFWFSLRSMCMTITVCNILIGCVKNISSEISHMQDCLDLQCQIGLYLISGRFVYFSLKPSPSKRLYLYDVFSDDKSISVLIFFWCGVGRNLSCLSFHGI